MAVSVTLMTASRGLRIFGSGTFSTRTSLVPYQQSAFIDVTSSARLSFCRRHFTGFDELLEAPQVLANLRRRVASHEPGDSTSDLAARWAVLEPHADARAAPGTGILEVHRAGGDHVGALERPPADHVVGD